MEDMPDQVIRFEIKESRTVEGIDVDYVWYNASLLRQKMSSWAMDFEKVVNVMEARHKEHIKMLQNLMDENAELKKKLKERE